MKLAKTITIIILAAALTISIFLNIIIAARLFLARKPNTYINCHCCYDYNEVTPDATTVYNDNGIRVVFVEQKYSPSGPALNFYIENYTAYTLDIWFADIYIDGVKADFSSLYCDNLPAGMKVYESLILWESDYEDFISFPSVVQFIIKVQDSSSWNTVVETEYINICLD